MAAKRIKLDEDDQILDLDYFQVPQHINRNGQDGHEPIQCLLEFDDLDDYCAYDMLKWLSLNGLIKYERVSKRFQSICRREQKNRKVLFIATDLAEVTYRLPSHLDCICDDPSHAPITPLLVEDIDLLPKILSKFINLTALYLKIYKDQNTHRWHPMDDPFEDIQALPSKLQHLHVEGFFYSKAIKKLNHLLDQINLKHLVFSNSSNDFGMHSVGHDQIRGLLDRPQLTMLCVSSSSHVMLDSMPGLRDYRCCCTEFKHLEHFQENKEQLVKLSIPFVSSFRTERNVVEVEQSTSRQIMSIVYKMKKLKHLVTKDYLPVLFNLPRFDHLAFIDFNSTNELMEGNYKIKKLLFPGQLPVQLPVDRIPIINSVEFYPIIRPNLNVNHLMNLLYSFGGLREVTGHFKFNNGKDFIKELIRKSYCFKYMIIIFDDLNEIYIKADPEFIDSLHSLVSKCPKTRFVVKCRNNFLPKDYNSRFDNLIIKREKEWIFTHVL